MTPSEIESWARRVIGSLASAATAEDFRLELKSQWPSDVPKAARRIAGHANAAHRQPILWLIGVDETTRTLVGTTPIEISNWHQQILAEFDGAIAPDLTHVNIDTEQGLVVALSFDTRRAPYVIKNPDGGRIQFEVPWRDTTRVRSAHRRDILQIFEVELSKLRFENVVFDLMLERDEDRPRVFWRFSGQAYFLAEPGKTFHVPLHRCKARMRFPQTGFQRDFTNLSFSFGVGENTRSNEQLFLRESGGLSIHSILHSQESQAEDVRGHNAEIEVSLEAVETEPLRIKLPLWQLKKTYREEVILRWFSDPAGP